MSVRPEVVPIGLVGSRVNFRNSYKSQLLIVNNYDISYNMS